jgi:hypothetical protein
MTDLRVRLAVALAIGICAVLFFLATTHNIVYGATTDFEFWWRAVRLWASGIDPYGMRPDTPLWPLPDRLYYPMPALIIAWPLHKFGLLLAGSLFVGLSASWLCWVLSADGLWRMWFFATPAFVMAARLGQWSPIISAATLVPAAGFLLATKPNLGVAAFAYRPTWRGAAGVAIILLVSIAMNTAWPREWLANIHSVRSHPSPIQVPFGWLLLLALMRWRQPEARLLIAMACIPQLLFFSDQLLLGLVTRTKNEAELFAGCGLAASLVWLIRAGANNPNLTGLAAPYVMLGCYLPALIIVLRRPNEGTVPAWLNRLTTVHWKKGVPSGDEVQ